jgi:hypothetical protein
VGWPYQVVLPDDLYLREAESRPGRLNQPSLTTVANREILALSFAGVSVMKKIYERPVLVRRELLSKVTAFNGGGSFPKGMFP